MQTRMTCKEHLLFTAYMGGFLVQTRTTCKELYGFKAYLWHRRFSGRTHEVVDMLLRGPQSVSELSQLSSNSRSISILQWVASCLLQTATPCYVSKACDMWTEAVASCL